MTEAEEEKLAAEGWIKHDGKGMPVGVARPDSRAADEAGRR